MTEPEWISLDEAQELLTMRPRTVTKLLAEGRLVGKKRSRYWFKVRKDSVLDYLDWRTERNLRPPSPLLRQKKHRKIANPKACQRCGIIDEPLNIQGLCATCVTEDETGHTVWYDNLPQPGTTWNLGKLTL